MKYQIEISEAAEADIKEAYLWYNSQLENLGEEFKNKIIDTVKLLEESPLLIQIKYKNIRVAFLKKFPFGVHFTVQKSKILIIGVFHTSKNPANWNKR